ncbi:MAG: D-aminoacyl-tRNA deacylase [Candidatus Delongbacteria bacterium]|jgi:D-tyrosyl-tRNA(Tyr) deacylase|nr:D-aminoacyl-tRNA deacylase [Candidatus Delongbacteria bacterium]
MKIIAQRVSSSKVIVNDSAISELGYGILLYVGFSQADTQFEADFLAEKILNLRIFDDDNDKMNLSIIDVGGQINIISQFTLYADTNKGRRPSFSNAMEPGKAEVLYQYFINIIKQSDLIVGEGLFGKYMQIESINEGPATFILEKYNT